jgi:uncharacterized membrane protein
MNRKMACFSAGVGAATMYLLDPLQGGRRRAGVRDKFARALHKSTDGVWVASRDLSHRSTGFVAETRARFKRETVSDDVLVARVRAALGRVCSHPHAIAVLADGGRVTLRGPILAREARRLISTVRSVQGVSQVIDQLDAHDRPDHIPALQGGSSFPHQNPGRGNWSPAARVVTGGAGAALLGYGLARRDITGGCVGLVGLSLITRAATNLKVTRLVGIGAGRRAMEVQQTISIDAPLEEVYGLWERYDEFPRFTAHVREVRKTREGESHWVIGLADGVQIQFDALITRQIPNRLLAWRSIGGSPVQHAGIVRFERNDDGSTGVHLRCSYNPPAGAIGHSVAALAGVDAKSLLDAELVRIKTYLETGRRPHDAAAPPPTEPESSAGTRGSENLPLV